MKLRTSFFNGAVLRKDITRFAPAWGLYLTGMLLLMLTLFPGSDYHLASDLGLTINLLSVVNLGYALVCGALLFGDLFHSRLCNALHAMPLRREGWFLTHAVSGLLFSVVPNLVVALCLMPRLGVYWYVALIWMGGMTATYLFFFGAAVLSAMCTGSRFAMTLVYGLINFLSILVMWVVEFLYIPLLYGIELNREGFVFLSPVSYLCTHELNYLNFLDKIYSYYNPNSGWPYTLGVAAVGVVMLVGALLLYRKRQLESAGDFITIRFLSPVFLVLYTMAAGILLFIFSSVFSVDREYLFLAVGITVGFLTGIMLLKRTVKIFKPASFAGLAVMLAVLFGSLGLARLDVLGIVRWVPEQDDVASVSLSYANDEYAYTAADQTEIGQLVQLHQQIIAAGGEADPWASNAYLTYTLSNGATVTRVYPLDYHNPVCLELVKWFSRPEYVLQTDDVEGFTDKVTYIVVEGDEHEIIAGEDARGLMAAIIADCRAGQMVQDWNYYNMYPETQLLGSVQINIPGKYDLYLNLWESAANTVAWLEEYWQASAGSGPQPRS